MDNKHNSLYFAQKHTYVFVLGHYLFLKAHSFCQIMSGQIFLNIFMPNRGYCLYRYINCHVMCLDQLLVSKYISRIIRMIMWEWCDHKAVVNLTDPSNFLALNMLLFFTRPTVIMNKFQTCVQSCITLLKLDKLKRDLEMNS